VTNQEIAEKIMANPCVWNPADGDNPYGSVDLDWIRDAITAALDAARPPAGHIMESDGTVRKVLGTLPVTADGYAVGKDAVIYWSNAAGYIHEMHVDERLNVTNGMLAISGDCYSTRELAEAAQRAAGGGA
jgi:hypothetical protein